MANISYTFKNNTCSNLNEGSIHINQINFDNEIEARSFLSYTIQWSGSSLLPSQISSDHRSIERLSSGTYSFSLFSLIDSSVIGPYNIEISTPEPLSIIDCYYSSSSCNKDDGLVNITVSGGTPPYSALCGIQRATSLSNMIALSGINSGEYTLKIIDNNGCSIDYDKIVINNRTLSASILQIIPPTLLDSYGIIKLRIDGDGPFDLEFINKDTQQSIRIDGPTINKYLIKKDENKSYYRIDDMVTPGSYLLNITNDAGCLFSISLNMRNIEPIKVRCYPERFSEPVRYSQHLTGAILDTVVIPFYHIKNNTNLWQFIKNLKLKDKISIKTNNNTIQYAIVRNILDKGDENKVEVLRLGPDPDDWFFYFYIAPGIHLSNYNDLFCDYKLIINNEEEYNLSKESLNKINPSILKGSFILNGTGYNQFCNKNNNAYINFKLNDSFDDYQYCLTLSSKQTFKTLYDIGYSTILSFLDNKDMLNTYANISDGSCVITENQLRYLSNVKQALNSINNISNIFNTYIYNSNIPSELNSLRIDISGNEFFSLEDKQRIENKYDVSYSLFDESSISPTIINKDRSTNLLDNIKDGYIIVKLQDLYNNKTKGISYNNLYIDYDVHFTEASNFIQDINHNIISYFNYGDILIYIGPKTIPNNIPHNITRDA